MEKMYRKGSWHFGVDINMKFEGWLNIWGRKVFEKLYYTWVCENECFRINR